MAEWDRLSELIKLVEGRAKAYTFKVNLNQTHEIEKQISISFSTFFQFVGLNFAERTL